MKRDCDTCRYFEVDFDCLPCSACRGFDKWEAQTNADHIRSMTDEELAEFLYAVDIREGATDTDGWLNFIKKPYGGDT